MWLRNRARGHPGERASLANAEMELWVEFIACHFAGEETLQDTWFKRGLPLSESQFAQQVEMSRLRVDLSANFPQAILQGPLNLWRAHRGGV